MSKIQHTNLSAGASSLLSTNPLQMKKLLLSSLITLCGAAGFAQNVVTTTQMGTANSASATQGGSSLTATIIQQGSGFTETVSNTAITGQTGTGSKAMVTQNGVSSFNKAMVTQAGTGQKATVSQTGPTSTSNTATVSQIGNTHEATVTQDNGASRNMAMVTQTATSNTATVTQTGAISNTATVEQNGTTSSAIVNQLDNATSNTAYIKQVSGSGSGAAINQTRFSGMPTDMNEASIIQYGDRQTAVTTQDGATGSFLSIKQGSAGTLSSDNRADSRQINGVTSSTATIEQNTTASGSLNKARTDQYGITALNYAMVSQQGSSNEAGLIQTGTGSNTATV